MVDLPLGHCVLMCSYTYCLQTFCLSVTVKEIMLYVKNVLNIKYTTRRSVGGQQYWYNNVFVVIVKEFGHIQNSTIKTLHTFTHLFAASYKTLQFFGTCHIHISVCMASSESYLSACTVIRTSSLLPSSRIDAGHPTRITTYKMDDGYRIHPTYHAPYVFIILFFLVLNRCNYF